MRIKGIKAEINSWQRGNRSAILQYNDFLFYSVGAYLGKMNGWLNSDVAVPASFIILLQFLIPEINDKLKKRLNQLVVQSVGKGLEAKRLLHQAKTRVEQLIEEVVQR